MKYVNFGRYAGFKQSGTVRIKKEGRPRHIQRASYLTAMVESGGKFGCALNYDGTGMTAGIHQAIAVYPKQLLNPDDNPRNDQGPLWRLLRKLQSLIPGEKLWETFKEWNCDIGADNILYRNQRVADGYTIRRMLSGDVRGQVKRSGIEANRARDFVQLFHNLFSNSLTFEAQEEFGIEHFAKRAERIKLRFATEYSQKTMNELFYSPNSCSQLLAKDFEPGLDLALCVYWSHSVNAPSIALRALCKVLNKCSPYNNNFPKRFIATIGNTKWGRWDDDIKNGRYVRTRRYAMQSHFWPKELFDGPNAIMPENLPD